MSEADRAPQATPLPSSLLGATTDISDSCDAAAERPACVDLATCLGPR